MNTDKELQTVTILTKGMCGKVSYETKTQFTGYLYTPEELAARDREVAEKAVRVLFDKNLFNNEGYVAKAIDEYLNTHYPIK